MGIACPLRPSGNTRAARARGHLFLSAIRFPLAKRTTMVIPYTGTGEREYIVRRRFPCAAWVKTHGASMTCMAMYMSGARTGMGTTRVAPRSTHQAPPPGLPVCCAAVPGATSLGAAGRRTGAGTYLAAGTARATVFVSRGLCLDLFSFTLVFIS